MNILGIDTSSSCATVALLKNDKMCAEVSYNHAKNHSTYLMPMIKNMLNACEMDINDIDYFACGVGPGSFTGVRIGVTTVNAFAKALNKKCIAIDSLYGLCMSNYEFCGVVVGIEDARNNRVYAHMTKNKQTIMESCILTIEELLCKLEEIKDDVLLIGSGADKYEDKLQGKKIKKDILVKARDIVYSSLECINCNDTIIMPKYILKSQAEREMDERNNSK